MSQDTDDMTRRTALKGLATTGAVAAAGAGGILATSGGAAASTTSLETNSVEATTPDGDVSRVLINPEGSVSWSGFDEDVKSIRVIIESRVLTEDDDPLTDFRTAMDQTYTVNGGKEDSFSHGNLGTVTLYGDGAGSTDPFDVDTDGASVKRKIEIKLTVQLLNESGGLANAGGHDQATIETSSKFYADSSNRAASSGATGKAHGEME